MTEAQIKHMVDRFLTWKLPKPWHPDNGITFAPTYQFNEQAIERDPSGTNLFDATQAKAMVEYMLEGLPEEAK